MKLYTGKELKDLRKKTGLTQKKLAELTGVSQSQIAKIESELIEPSHKTIVLIVNVLEKKIKKQLSIKKIINKNIVCINTKNTLQEAIDTMKKHSVSQLPVIENDKVFGVISEKSIIENFSKSKKIIDYIQSQPPIISEETSYEIVGFLLKENDIVLIKKREKIIGIISRQDWFDAHFN